MEINTYSPLVLDHTLLLLSFINMVAATCLHLKNEKIMTNADSDLKKLIKMRWETIKIQMLNILVIVFIEIGFAIAQIYWLLSGYSGNLEGMTDWMWSALFMLVHFYFSYICVGSKKILTMCLKQRDSE